MGGGDAPDAPDVVGAAREEAEANRRAAQREMFANRVDQHGPMSSTTWNHSMIDANTGEALVSLPDGTLVPQSWYDANSGDGQYLYGDSSGHMDHWSEINRGVAGADNPLVGTNHVYYDGGPIDSVTDWTQTTTLNPEWQAVVDQQRELIGQQSDYRSGQINDWSNNALDYSGFGQGIGNSLGNTIGRGDLDQFGQTQTTTGAQDWRQFGTTGQTIGSDQWQNIGQAQQTLGADDWRQFGNTDTTISSGDFDARFGGAGDHGFGDHGQTGGGWDQVQYAPDAIRRQAEQQTLDFMNSQLDPQWDSRMKDLEIKLTNQGLQPGDAAYDNAMASQKRSRDTAYSGARNQALADSRAEANMLWNQQMGMSEQKNMQHQADIDNIYRARQANIGNYQQGRQQDMQGYLDYQQAAFGQDLAQRQQQLDANYQYGQGAFNQDFQNRQQALDSQLAYGRESFGQDFQSRQQQLDANRLYNQQAFDQDLASRQANISNYLNYGNAEFGQNLSREQLNLSSQELALRAQIEQENQMQNRYSLANPTETYSGLQSALQG